MTEQGGSYELDRDGAARAVAILSLHEDRFLSGLRDNPESTLWSYGFALSPREMETIRGAFGSAQDGVIEANKADRIQAIRTGDPGYFRATTPSGQLAFAGTAGVKSEDGSRPNFLLNAKTFVEGQFVDITGMKYVVPKMF